MANWRRQMNIFQAFLEIAPALHLNAQHIFAISIAGNMPAILDGEAIAYELKANEDTHQRRFYCYCD